MSRPWTQEWFDDCEKWYNLKGLNTLRGRYAHWCPNSALVPVDETCALFEKCKCFRCKCGELLVPHFYPFGRRVMEMHDDIFECPKSRMWNYWKHDRYNLYFDDRPNRG